MTAVPIILASHSPRRRELLQRMGLEFTVVTPDENCEPAITVGPPTAPASNKSRLRDFVGETGGETNPAAHRVDIGEAVQAAACAKAQSVAQQVQGKALVIGADTVVHFAGCVLGKPSGREEAAAMLRFISGRVHEVITGLCVVNAESGQCESSYVTTQVEFRPLSEEEIAAYVATGEPLDKAGAYGIQGFGGLLVKRINGCYFNVVGLPLSALNDLLLRAGLNVLQMAAERQDRA